jgi:hypothetical protein
MKCLGYFLNQPFTSFNLENIFGFFEEEEAKNILNIFKKSIKSHNHRIEWFLKSQ